MSHPGCFVPTPTAPERSRPFTLWIVFVLWSLWIVGGLLVTLGLAFSTKQIVPTLLRMALLALMALAVVWLIQLRPRAVRLLSVLFVLWALSPFRLLLLDRESFELRGLGMPALIGLTWAYARRLTGRTTAPLGEAEELNAANKAAPGDGHDGAVS